MDKEKKLSEWHKLGLKVLGRFKNRYGERFFVLKPPIKKLTFYFIAGDETDWILYEYFPRIKLMCQTFTLSEEETKKIERIISKQN